MTDDPQYTNIPLLATFLKHFKCAFLGPEPAKSLTEGVEVVSPPVEDTKLPTGMQELVPEKIQQELKKMFDKYFDSASKTLVKGQVVRR